jgi:hypothetical protein
MGDLFLRHPPPIATLTGCDPQYAGLQIQRCGLTLVGYLLIIDRKVAVSGDDREQPQLPVINGTSNTMKILDFDSKSMLFFSSAIMI